MITNKYKVSSIKSIHPRDTVPPRPPLTRCPHTYVSTSLLLTLQSLLYRTLHGPHGLRPVATMYTAYPADGGTRW